MMDGLYSDKMLLTPCDVTVNDETAPMISPL